MTLILSAQPVVSFIDDESNASFWYDYQAYLASDGSKLKAAISGAIERADYYATLADKCPEISLETLLIMRQCTRWNEIPLPAATIGGRDDQEPFDYADAVARHGRMATL